MQVDIQFYKIAAIHTRHDDRTGNGWTKYLHLNMSKN